MKKNLSLLCLLICMTQINLSAQLRNDDVYKMTEVNNFNTRHEIRIPDFGGFTTLKCDLHIHTVFSDGSVWPDVRVYEAWQEGLDAIAITDHIEYRPHKDIIKSDFNESFKIASNAAASNGLIVIHGSEITRSKPLGHLNALFIDDSNPLDVEDPLKAIDEALKQNAFIMWNHPGWPDNKSTFYPIHEELIKAGKIHGVEVCNHKEYYPAVFDWFTPNNLAPMANTDEHQTVKSDFVGTRPMTLVFSKERSLSGIREALFARRTAAYFGGLLVGQADLLRNLVIASLKVNIINDKTITVTNISDIPFKATANGELYIIPEGQTLKMNMPEQSTVFTIENCFYGKDKKLTLSASDFSF